MQNPSKIELDLLNKNWILFNNSPNKTYYTFVPGTTRVPQALCLINKYDAAKNLIGTESKQYKITTGKGRFVLWLDNEEFFIDIADIPNPKSFILTHRGIRNEFRISDQKDVKQN